MFTLFQTGYLRDLTGHHPEFSLAIRLLLLRAQASSGIFHFSAGHGWVRTWIAFVVDFSSSYKCLALWIMSLPRPILKIHVGLISRRVLGNLQRVPSCWYTSNCCTCWERNETAQEWKKNEHYVVPASIDSFPSKCFTSFNMFRWPTSGAQI